MKNKNIKTTNIFIGIALGTLLSIGAIIGGYYVIKSDACAAEAGSQQEEKAQRFVEIDSSGLSGGTVYVDTKTDVEYAVVQVYTAIGPNGYGVAVTMTPLYDKDGKSLKWTPEE